MNRIGSMPKRRRQVVRFTLSAPGTLPPTVNLGLSQNVCKQ